MDVFKPARHLRHKFSKALVDTYEEDRFGSSLAKPGIGLALAGILMAGGSVLVEDITYGEITPDDRHGADAVEIFGEFDRQIDALAQQRQEFLTIQQSAGYVSGEEAENLEETGRTIRDEATALTGRIVMSEALSEQQAAELLNNFSQEISPIDEIGFETSDFGHLRESREEVRQDLGTHWRMAAEKVTKLAAEYDRTDHNQPYRFFDEDAGVGERVSGSLLTGLMGGMFGVMGGLMWLLMTLVAGDSRKIQEWAREKPQTQKSGRFKH